MNYVLTFTSRFSLGLCPYSVLHSPTHAAQYIMAVSSADLRRRLCRRVWVHFKRQTLAVITNTNALGNAPTVRSPFSYRGISVIFQETAQFLVPVFLYLRHSLVGGGGRLMFSSMPSMAYKHKNRNITMIHTMHTRNSITN
jgi:hypothetical protein